MSTNPIFLNCRVRKVDGSPIVGIHARLLCLSQPNTLFDGFTDSSGEAWGWSHHVMMDEPPCWLRCSQGSCWRVIFDIPNHVLPGISADLVISGNADANANITLTIAPNTVAVTVWEPAPRFFPDHYEKRSSLGSSTLLSFNIDCKTTLLYAEVNAVKAIPLEFHNNPNW